MKTPPALQAVKDNPEFLSLFNQGMSLLHRSGVFTFLRDNGRVFPASPEVPNYVDYQAAIANWSVGYNAAIDHLLRFREIFLDENADANKMQPDFGALDRALENGDLTQEEINALRSGNTASIANFSKPSGGINRKT